MLDVMDEMNVLNLKRCSLLGLPMTAISLNETVVLVETAIKDNQSIFLSTPNLNFVFTSLKDKQFYNSILESDLVVADGMPLIWVAKFLGIPIKERVAGSDLFERLSSEPRKQKIRVFFFGGAAGVAEKAHKQLNSNSKGMFSCGYYAPGFVTVEAMSSAEILANINEKQPDFIVVALGAKKGQEWILKNKRQLNARVISHLGAVINFVAGEVQRSPGLFQKIGLEWLWRIYQEPILFKRYFKDGLNFILMIFCKIIPLKVFNGLARAFENIKKPSAYAYTVIDSSQQNTLIIRLGKNLYEIRETFQKVLADAGRATVILDCKNMNFSDASLMAELLVFQHALRNNDREMLIKNLSLAGHVAFWFQSVRNQFTFA